VFQEASFGEGKPQASGIRHQASVTIETRKGKLFAKNLRPFAHPAPKPNMGVDQMVMRTFVDYVGDKVSKGETVIIPTAKCIAEGLVDERW
jgi:hypothetical protein